ncbi:hypothetical protein PLESTB_000260100 [Pleodorina starrii]|uniref:Uncharacterized protein n=1 Tax=Pleodorina starrii TaxID=330485 RepID=A0A9W6EYJ0_9CHLO|nr:hypothetical protein PLESTB_000260100 [Pleodorina starrii]GLC77265.1 hypothetical protein PLESTF_001906600 [Pleodorina starrii]
MSRGGASSTEVVFSGGQFGAGWHDSSYNARPFTSSAPAGKDSGTAWCNYLPKDAATSFWGPQGAFSGRRALEFWAYAGDQGVADLDLLLYGASANACSRVALSELSVVESSGGWVKYWVDLYRFSWEQQGGGGGGGSPSFSGCGSSGTSAGELVKLDLLNLRHPEYEALLCIDNVRLVA